MSKRKFTKSKNYIRLLVLPLSLSLMLTGTVIFSKDAHAATTNIVVGKSITASDSISGTSSFVTDGDANSNNYVGVTQNLQWIQIDLGQACNINKVGLWHYFADGRIYHDVIVRVSNDPSFNSGVTTVFNNDRNNSAGLGTGTDAEYAETSAGKSITFPTVNARYVRLHSNGSDVNVYNHYSEVQVWSADTVIPSPNKFMFDDFNYNNSDDSNLGTHGWTLKNGIAGPGPEGCNFSKNNISFLTDPQNSSNKLMRLTASTDGTAKGTSEAEIYTSNRKFNKGTYAARVRFTDEPVSGTDGAGINQTFFTISPLESYRDPNYSELDFEYLANGGWAQGQAMWTTSWHTYTATPWYKDGSSKFDVKSYAGWHDLIINVAADGTTTYFIDGKQFIQDGPYYGPRKLMNIDFNLWFITGKGENPLNASTYVQDVDWVYYAQDTILSPDQVNSVVQNLKLSGVTFKDTVPNV